MSGVRAGRAYVRRTVTATMLADQVLKPNFLSHEISADLKAGGDRAVAARERIRALIIECHGMPRRMAERAETSRSTVHRWLGLEGNEDLAELARVTREASGEADERMAKARAARKPRN